ncbi:MAG: lipid-binding SYLF domain-containing protein [Acidobacteria bacterium]|nr:lipid-binding SYLF domain-containing protein [Acidobacteriota bacterium]
MRNILFFLITAMLAAANSGPTTTTDKRLAASAEVFQEIMGVADRAIPQKLLDKAECIVLVPGMKKGALIVGGKYGRGFVSCRRTGGAGWGPLAGVRMEGGSFGLQIGGAETDVIMLVMNARGVKRLSQSKFTLGADASVAAGPVGRQATAETDALMTAEILTWSRSRGVFAGVSLQGVTLRSDKSANQNMYQQPAWGILQIVQSGLDAPPAAEAVLKLLNKYSSRK